MGAETRDACACGPDECLNAGGPGCYFGEAPSVEKDASLTLAEASEIVGDDIAYWLNNPFLDREAVAEKVCFWVAQARVTSLADGGER